MIWHIIGWVTFAVTILTTGVGVECMRVASRESRTWCRPLRTPKFADVPLTQSSGADFVGLV